jgi:hypothetical protein
MSPSAKKRKAKDSETVASSKKSALGEKSNTSALEDPNVFTPLSLEEIRSKIQSLCTRVPVIPSDNFGADEDHNEHGVRDWAAQLQAVLEEFNLLVCCVATATYQWGTDRSGAADQNLSLLSGELAASQEQIASTVTPRLTNVLAPVVDLVVEKVVTKKVDGEKEVKENHYTRKLVDPDFVKLCHQILARNAPLLRHVVLANFQKLMQCLKDYIQAHQKDGQHNRAFAY